MAIYFAATVVLVAGEAAVINGAIQSIIRDAPFIQFVKYNCSDDKYTNAKEGSNLRGAMKILVSLLGLRNEHQRVDRDTSSDYAKENSKAFDLVNPSVYEGAFMQVSRPGPRSNTARLGRRHPAAVSDAKDEGTAHLKRESALGLLWPVMAVMKALEAIGRARRWL